jgi:hypothetical protein
MFFLTPSISKNHLGLRRLVAIVAFASWGFIYVLSQVLGNSIFLYHFLGWLWRLPISVTSSIMVLSNKFRFKSINNNVTLCPFEVNMSMSLHIYKQCFLFSRHESQCTYLIHQLGHLSKILFIMLRWGSYHIFLPSCLLYLLYVVSNLSPFFVPKCPGANDLWGYAQKQLNSINEMVQDHMLTCSYMRDFDCSSWQTKILLTD